MAEIVDEIISLHGGISQQDVALRLEHQVEESINCYHTIESGLRRRNPTQELGVATGIDSDCFTYNYDRGLAGDLNEKYSIMYDENGFRALDINNGTVIPVVDNSGTYMQPYTSETGYSAVTVKDVTFITNRNKVVSTTADVSASQVDEAFIWVQRAEPVDGYTYTVKLRLTDTTEHTITVTAKLTTNTVANDIQSKLNALANVTAEVDGNIVRVTSSVGLEYVSASDSYGDLAIASLYKEVQTEDDLPPTMPFDCKVIVTGLDNSKDNYYLESINGQWKETVGYDTYYSLDSSTMPHKITRLFDVNNDPYFQIDPVDWEDKGVGDEDNARQPSFIGTSITDICFFKNRLGLLTPASILFSEVGQYYNFWKTTQVVVLDSDRIDTDLDARKAIRLHYINFLQDDMIIFGDKTQFRINHTGVFTSSTISATIISEYAFNPKVRPIAIDNKLIFTALNNNNTAVYSFVKDAYGETNSANNITQHIPYFLDKDISQIVGSSVNSVLFFRSETEKNKLYVYKYLEDGGKLLQSAWFEWNFTADIHSIFCTEGRLYLLTSRYETLTDIDWTMYDGSWDDAQNWLDEGIWSDDTFLLSDKLEAIDIIPNQVTDTYYDVGNVEYTSLVKLSEYLPTMNSKKSISNKINLKTIYVKANNDSIFELEIANLERNTERTITQQYVLNRRPYIMGKAKDTRISIKSTDGYGFEINGVAIEARINNRSKRI